MPREAPTSSTSSLFTEAAAPPAAFLAIKSRSSLRKRCRCGGSCMLTPLSSLTRLLVLLDAFLPPETAGMLLGWVEATSRGRRGQRRGGHRRHRREGCRQRGERRNWRRGRGDYTRREQGSPFARRARPVVAASSRKNATPELRLRLVLRGLGPGSCPGVTKILLPALPRHPFGGTPGQKDEK